MSSPGKRRSRNLFRTGLDRLVGRHKDNVYKVTVIQNNSADKHGVMSNSDYDIPTEASHVNHINREQDHLDDKAPKLPQRRRSRPSRENSYKEFECHNKETSKMNSVKHDYAPPIAPPRRRSQHSSQHSCRSYDLHEPSPSPSRPPRRRTYSQSSYKMIPLTTKVTPLKASKANV